MKQNTDILFPQWQIDRIDKRKNKRITINDVIGLPDKNVNQAAIKSVLSPSATYNITLQSGTKLEQLVHQINAVLYSKNELSYFDKAVLELLFLNGARINEVLNIRGANVDHIGNIQIKGLKGSGNRILSPGQYRSFWLNWKKTNYTIGSVYSYWYWYRLLKAKGIYITLDNQLQHRVTHVFRHIYITMAYNVNKDLDTIKNDVGHKSEKSTKSYIHNGEETRSESTRNTRKSRRSNSGNSITKKRDN